MASQEIPVRRREGPPLIPDRPVQVRLESRPLSSPVSACRGCSADWGRPGAATRVLDLGEQPLAENDDGNRYPLELFRCGRCGLVQLGCVIDRSRVFRPAHPYVTGATKAMRGHFAGLAYKVAPLFRAHELVLDIGCNDGTFLAALAGVRPKARVLGVEPTGAADLARKQGIPVLQEFWSALSVSRVLRSYGRAKVVTASNVMAHTEDVHGFLDAVARVLTPDGIFIAECHDWASVVLGLQVDTVYHEHVLYYTPATFGRLLEMHGFTVTGTEMIPAHGGSFRIQAVRASAGLQDRADATALELRRLLETAAQAGPVYGIGAATRATPLIHWAGLEPYLAKVCEVPGHPKIGTRIPGTGLEIVDEAELTRDQPPYALLLCWHVAGDVVPKLRAAGYEGTFLVPLPRPETYHD